MAERRMFSKTIIDSDAFLDMPLSTQTLYFHLGMRADDDGFVNNPRKIQRMIGCSDDDLRLLIAKAFIIAFDSGIVVIKHWRINNYIQKDRYKETVYQDEKSMLETKGNNAYTRLETFEDVLDTPCIQDVSKMDSQVSIGKDNIYNIAELESQCQPSTAKVAQGKQKPAASPNPNNICSKAIQLLNDLSGSSFRSTTKATQKLISARVKDGYTPEDFEAVIRHQCDLWGKDKNMSKYLRPETLFGNKFEGYLSEARKNSPAPEQGYTLASIEDPWEVAMRGGADHV